MKGEHARILIVEDETVSALAIKSSLETMGHTVTSIADSGLKAIEKTVQDRPDFILMDIHLKGEMDGIEAADIIRSRFDIPIIFSTAHLNGERIERVMSDPPFGYILKPIRDRDLKVAIQMALYVVKVNAERRRTARKLEALDGALKAAQKKSEKELARYRESLEELVQTRTSELALMVKEKEILLQEVHHRVKNNLQIISSLIGMQRLRTREEEFSRVLAYFQNRIHAMGLVHEQLYQSENLAQIDFASYISRLVSNLLKSEETSSEHITVFYDLEHETINLGQVIPCGLIINELITNALKHAFPGNRKGEIRLEFKRNGSTDTLSVEDNGIGLHDSFDLSKVTSMGLKIVQIFVDQLHANLEIEKGAGTRFNITLKNSAHA